MIVASGPSLTQADVDLCRGRARMIVINTSYLMALDADVHYFCDPKLYNWRKDDPEWDRFKGQRLTLEASGKLLSPYATVRNAGTAGFDIRPTHIKTGRNSGYQAVHVAAHLGVAEIILLGYDMKPGPGGEMHWHKEHPTATRPGVIESAWLQHWDSIAKALKKRGINVTNCTRDTALTVFPVKQLEDVI